MVYFRYSRCRSTLIIQVALVFYWIIAKQRPRQSQ